MFVQVWGGMQNQLPIRRGCFVMRGKPQFDLSSFSLALRLIRCRLNSFVSKPLQYR